MGDVIFGILFVIFICIVFFRLYKLHVKEVNILKKELKEKNMFKSTFKLLEYIQKNTEVQCSISIYFKEEKMNIEIRYKGYIYRCTFTKKEIIFAQDDILKIELDMLIRSFNKRIKNVLIKKHNQKKETVSSAIKAYGTKQFLSNQILNDLKILEEIKQKYKVTYKEMDEAKEMARTTSKALISCLRNVIAERGK